MAFRRFFAALTILSVTFTQVLPAWALRPGAGVDDPKGAVRAGLEERLLDTAASSSLVSAAAASRALAAVPRADVWSPLAETVGNDFGLVETARAVSGRSDGVFVIRGLSMSQAGRPAPTAIFSSELTINADEVAAQLSILKRGTEDRDALSRGERTAFDRIVRLAAQAKPADLLKEVASLARRKGADADAARYVAALYHLSGALCGHFSYPGSRQPIREPIHGIEQIQAEDLEPVFDLLARGNLEAVTRQDPAAPVYVARESDLKLEGEQYKVSLRRVEAKGKTSAPLGDVVVGQTAEEEGLLRDWKSLQVETAQLLERYGDKKSTDYKKPGAYRKVEAARDRERQARRGLLSAVTRRIHEANASFRNNVLEDYLGGDTQLQRLLEIAQGLKRGDQFTRLVRHPKQQRALKDLAARLQKEIAREEKAQQEARSEQRFKGVADLLMMRNRLAKIQDVVWEIEQETLGLIQERIPGLIADPESGKPLTTEEISELSDGTLRELLAMDTVFSAFDRNQESRGRDSLGIAATYQFRNRAAYEKFQRDVLSEEERSEFVRRSDTSQTPNLVNRAITVREDPSGQVAVTLVYKTAQLVGRLGDNVTRLKREMTTDRILQKMIRRVESMKLAHTRWASAGIISIENAHPQNNQALYTVQADGQKKTVEVIMEIPVDRTPYGKPGNIFVVLNGDITNYSRSELLGDRYLPDLLREFTDRPLPPDVTRKIADEITTDTKIIPLVIEEFLARGYILQEAFRHAVRRFSGSFSIQMTSDLEPDKVFIARGGDGQGLYVGISPDGLIPASEPMGFVRRTNHYVNIEPYKWEEPIPVQPGKKQQFETPVIAVIDRNEPPTVESIHLYRADNGDPLPLTENDIESTPATMRDIAMGGNPSFFIKEVFGSADMFESTIEGRCIVEKRADGREAVEINLDDEQLPKKVAERFKPGHEKPIRRVIATGMGTAEAAAKVGAASIEEDLKRAGYTGTVETMSSIELGQFALESDMSDVLIIAVTQSGGTKDLNAALLEAQKRGAVILAVVNKRDSEAVFIARKSGGGVYYTGTGRDIEIAVASTKAYYAQIGALSVLGMGMAQAIGLSEQDSYLVDEAKALLDIPTGLRKILSGVPKTLPEDPNAVFDPRPDEHPIVRATYAMQRRGNGSIAGDGPGALSAEEIGVKYRELNYATVNVKNSVADVKHEDTAAEAWQLWALANVRGTSGNYWRDVVIGELEKVRAHQNPPTFICTEAEAKQHLLDRNGKPKYKVKWERSDGTTFERPIDLIYVPETNEHFAPIYHALVGHLIAYHNALRINRLSQMIGEAHAAVRDAWDERADRGLFPEQIVKDFGFQQIVKTAFDPLLELRTRLGIHFPLPGHLQGVWDDLRTMVDRLQGNGRFDVEVEYQGETQPFIAVFSDRAGRIRRELARGIDSIRHQAKFVTVGIEIGGQVVSQVLLPLAESLERAGLFSETINTALVLYLNYLRDEKSRVQLLEDPFGAPTRSRLVVLSPDGIDLARVVHNAIDHVPTHPQVVGTTAVPFQSEDGTQFRVIEAVLDQPISALAAGLEEQIPPVVSLVQDAIHRQLLGIVEEVGNWLVTENGVLIGKPGTSIGVNLANLHPLTIREKVEPGVRLVGTSTVVEKDAAIGRGTYVQNVVIRRNARVGAGSVLITNLEKESDVKTWALSPQSPYKAQSVPTEVGEDASIAEGTHLLNFRVGARSVWNRSGTYPNVGLNGEIGEDVKGTTAKIQLARIAAGSVFGNFEGNFEEGRVTSPIEITDFVGRPGQRIGQAGRTGSFRVEYSEGFYFPPMVLGPKGYEERGFMSNRGTQGELAIPLEFSGTLNPNQTEITRITGEEDSGHGIVSFGFGWVMGGASKLIGTLDKWTRNDIVTAFDVLRRFDRTYLGHFAVLAPRGFHYVTADQRSEQATGEGWGRIGNFSLRGDLTAREEVHAWTLDHAVDVILSQMAEEFRALSDSRALEDPKVRAQFDAFVQDAIISEISELTDERSRLVKEIRALREDTPAGKKRKDEVRQRINIVNEGLHRLEAHRDSGAWEGQWRIRQEDGLPAFGSWWRENGRWMKHDGIYKGYPDEQYTLEELARSQPGQGHPAHPWDPPLTQEDWQQILNLFQRPGRGSISPQAEVHGQVHSSAVIKAGAKIEEGAIVGPGVVVEERAVVEAGATLAYCYIDRDATVPSRSRLYGVIVAPGANAGAKSHLRLSMVGSKGEAKPTRLGERNTLSQSKVMDGSQLGDANVILCSAVLDGSHLGNGNTMTYGWARHIIVGDRNTLNSRMENNVWGNNNRNDHFASYLTEEKIEPAAIYIPGVSGAEVHPVVTHGAYSTLKGRPGAPIRVIGGAFFAGLMQVEAGAVLEALSFAKGRLRAETMLMDFSQGPGLDAKDPAGILERNGPAFIFRFGLSYPMKGTPEKDKWAVGYLIEDGAIKNIRRMVLLLGGLGPLGEQVVPDIQELERLVKTDWRNTESSSPSVKVDRARLVAGILARIAPAIEQEEERQTPAAPGEYSRLQMLQWVRRVVAALDGRYRLRYAGKDQGIVFTEGKWVYNPRTGEARAGVYTWVPKPPESAPALTGQKPIAPVTAPAAPALPSAPRTLQEMAQHLTDQFAAERGIYLDSDYDSQTDRTTFVVIGEANQPGLVEAVLAPLAGVRANVLDHGPLQDHGDISYIIVAGQVSSETAESIRDRVDSLTPLHFAGFLRQANPFLTPEQIDTLHEDFRTAQAGDLSVTLSASPYPSSPSAQAVITIGFPDLPQGDPRRDQILSPNPQPAGEEDRFLGTIPNAVKAAGRKIVGQPMDVSYRGVRLVKLIVDNVEGSDSARGAMENIRQALAAFVPQLSGASEAPLAGLEEAPISAVAGFPRQVAIGIPEQLVVLGREMNGTGVVPVLTVGSAAYGPIFADPAGLAVGIVMQAARLEDGRALPQRFVVADEGQEQVLLRLLAPERHDEIVQAWQHGGVEGAIEFAEQQLAKAGVIPWAVRSISTAHGDLLAQLQELAALLEAGDYDAVFAADLAKRILDLYL